MGRLFWKFFVSIWVAQLLAVVGVGSGIWIKDRNNAFRTSGIETGPPVHFVLDAIEVALQAGGSDGLRGLLSKNQHERVYALDPQGRDILGRPLAPGLLDQVLKLQASGDGGRVLRKMQGADGKPWLVFVGRRLFPRGPNGAQGALAGPGGPERPPQPGHLPRFPFIPMLFALIASLASAAVLAWYFATPIRRLRAAFDAVASGHLDTRLGAGAGRRRDELADLGRDFDRMAGRLQELVEGQRRLLHDVSHELRSPLARLQMAVGLARQKPDKTEASFERIERESARMDAMIGELLTLSRLESGTALAMDETVAIDELLLGIVDDAAFEAQAAGKHVRLHPGCGAGVRGNAELLHSALENVVRNAVRHTADGSTVDVRVERGERDGQLRILIRDHGEGVPEQELQAIFRPFVRSSASVKRQQGHGLGLAIAERIVAAHRGRIHARNAEGGGLCVVIDLPCLDER